MNRVIILIIFITFSLIRQSYGIPMVDIGGAMIVDGGAGDNTVVGGVDTMPGVITFSIVDAATGYTADGRVTIGGAGALVGLVGAASIVNLTDLFVTRPAGAAGGALAIDFEETFAVPLPPVNVADGIDGQFTNLLAPFFVGAGTGLTYQGFVNGAGIGPIFATPAIAAPVGAPVPIMDSDLVFGIVGGPPWTLRGELSVTLGVIGDQLVLDNSAEVGVASESVPEPTTLALMALGFAGLGFVRRRRCGVKQSK